MSIFPIINTGEVLMKIRKSKVWLKILFAVVIPGLVLNLLFLNATTSGTSNISTPSVADNNSMVNYLRNKYQPGQILSPEDFRANAALFGSQVKSFDTLLRLDSRTEDIIAKEGFAPNPKMQIGTGWDHFGGTTGSFVSAASAETVVDVDPVFAKIKAEHDFGIRFPINNFANDYLNSQTPPPPKEFVTRAYRIRNVEGIQAPIHWESPGGGIKGALPYGEVLIRGVSAQQIDGVAETTRITVHSWKRSEIIDIDGSKKIGPWIPDQTSGHKYDFWEFAMEYDHKTERVFRPLNPTPNNAIPLAERSRNLIEPTVDVQRASGKNVAAKIAFNESIHPQPTNITPNVSTPKNLNSVTVGNAPRIFAARAGSAALVASVLSETSKLSERLKTEKDPIKRNEMINQAATSLNDGVLGAGLFTVGAAGATYLGIALIAGTAVATATAPVVATSMLIALIPLAVDQLADPQVLSGMAKAVLDPQSTATTSWKVLQADFSNGQDFFSNMVGFAGYLKDQLLELRNPNNETLTQAVARAAIKNDGAIDPATLSEKKINQTASASESAWRNFKAGNVTGTTSVASTNSAWTGGAPTVSNSGGNNAGNSTGSIGNVSGVARINVISPQSEANVVVPVIPANLNGSQSFIPTVNSISKIDIGNSPNLPYFSLGGPVDIGTSPLFNDIDGKQYWYDTGGLYQPNKTKVIFRGDTLIAFERIDKHGTTFVPAILTTSQFDSGVATWSSTPVGPAIDDSVQQFNHDGSFRYVPINSVKGSSSGGLNW